MKAKGSRIPGFVSLESEYRQGGTARSARGMLAVDMLGADQCPDGPGFRQDFPLGNTQSHVDRPHYGSFGRQRTHGKLGAAKLVALDDLAGCLEQSWPGTHAPSQDDQ